MIVSVRPSRGARERSGIFHEAASEVLYRPRKREVLPHDPPPEVGPEVLPGGGNRLPGGLLFAYDRVNIDRPNFPGVHPVEDIFLCEDGVKLRGERGL